MKKTLSVLLALTMLLALCVPAFAAVTTPADPSAPGALVKIDDVLDAEHTTPGAPQSASGTVIVNGAAVKETFSVSFPAQCNIAWNDTTTAVDMGYTVEYVLAAGRQLKVTVAGDGVMTAANASNQSKLQLVNDGGNFVPAPAKVFTGASTAPETPFLAGGEMKYHVQSFAGMPLDDYTATFTYTVECGAAA